MTVADTVPGESPARESGSVWTRLYYPLVGLFVLLAACFKIEDLDFWWHLKTGQIILRDWAFQTRDIYSFTAAGSEYLDHEWLFQVIAYLAWSAAGALGVILLKCLLLVALYLLIARFLLHNGASIPLALALVLLSICGGRTRFIERPELFSELFLVALYLLIHAYLRTRRAGILALALPIIVVWSNIHAAVVLGLTLELCFAAGLILESLLAGTGHPAFRHHGKAAVVALAAVFAASLLVTGINPLGYRVLKVPFELTRLIDSVVVNNQEWQHPPLQGQPFFYACLAFTFLVMLVDSRRLQLVNLFLAGFLGYISLKYVRNVAFFSIFMPLLVAPHLKALSLRLARPRLALWAVSAGLLWFIVAANPFLPGIGISPGFPRRLVDFTKAKDLRGNMLNSYGFGGYLIWTLHPERKVFIDGRNEVYVPLLKQLKEAASDSRRWTALLRNYGIEYAILNYVDNLEELTIYDAAGKSVTTYAPFSETHFPRSAWALVDWDDTGMILVRRKGPNQNLLPLEYASVYPEGEAYQESLAHAGRIDRAAAIGELKRKLEEDPSCQRAARLLEAMLKM